MSIGASILLLAIGAILAFATSIDPTPFAGMSIEWTTVGVILMAVGIIGLLWSIAMLSAWRDRGARRDTVVPVEREQTIIER